MSVESFFYELENYSNLHCHLRSMFTNCTYGDVNEFLVLLTLYFSEHSWVLLFSQSWFSFLSTEENRFVLMLNAHHVWLLKLLIYRSAYGLRPILQIFFFKILQIFLLNLSFYNMELLWDLEQHFRSENGDEKQLFKRLCPSVSLSGSGSVCFLKTRDFK